MHGSSALQHGKFRSRETIAKQKVGEKKAVPNFEEESNTVNIPNDQA